jgi:hypothetical protein
MSPAVAALAGRGSAGTLAARARQSSRVPGAPLSLAPIEPPNHARLYGCWIRLSSNAVTDQSARGALLSMKAISCAAFSLKFSGAEMNACTNTSLLGASIA